MVLIAMTGASWAANEVRLGTNQGKPNVNIPIELTLLSDQQVQGFVSVAEWDGSVLPSGSVAGVGLSLSPIVQTADVAVTRLGLDPVTKVGFFVIGVVMDSDGVDGEIIPANMAGTLLATLSLKWTPTDPIPESFVEQVVPIVFVDGKYASSELGGPLLDNIVVVGGMSIGVGDDPPLLATNGSVKLLAPAAGTVTIVSKADAKFTEPATVKVQLESLSAVQGFVLSIQAEAGLVIDMIDASGAASTADFKSAEFFPPAGVTLGVIMDFAEPWNTPPPIPAGTHEIATLTVHSTVTITAADCARGPETYDLKFVDLAYGDPLKENVIVIAGQSKAPDKVDGTVTFSVDKTKPPCKIETGILFAYAAGSCSLVDDPDSADKDVHKPGDIEVTRGTANAPGKFQVGLWYRNPPNPYQSDEGPNQLEQIQGLSMALQFDPKCIWCDGTYSLAGTITETVGAEFVNVLCENREDDIGSDELMLPDGTPIVPPLPDPGELIVGILVDALPPFDGQDLPPSADYLKVVCVDFHVTNPEGDCNDCQNVTLTFPEYPFGADIVDPVTGVESPVIRNLATIRRRIEVAPGEWVTVQESVLPKQLVPGKVIILKEPTFVRGNCNWSEVPRDDAHTQMAVDISDAAAVISFLFYTGTWQFLPPCLDACDANDDGRIDLADAVYILRYLYKFDKMPPLPFPDPGIDPTPDRLDCKAGSVCD